MTSRESIITADLPIVDIARPDFWQDIHRPLAEARDRSPAMRTTDGAIYLLRADDVETMLRDGRFLASDLLGLQGLRSGPVWEWWMRVMFSRNPPDHTRLRRLVGKAFTSRRVAGFRGEIRSQVTDLLEPALASGKVEMIADVTHVLASNVTAAFIGIPREDWLTFREWTSDIGLAFGAAVDPDIRRRVETALAELDTYVNGLLERRRSNPSPDLLSALLAVEDAGDRLSRQELVDLVENLMFAGHDTTRSGIAVVMKVLAENADAFARLRTDRSLLPATVDEALRYENIIFTTVREASEDLEIADLHVSAGTPLAACFPSACRDSRRYSNPDRVDITRRENSTVFGVGIHFCLGAALARAEMQEVVDQMVHACSSVELAEPVRWTPLAHIRRPEEVRLALTVV
ncbi:cytochrome P450 hydroxylase [Pseudonocardia sulfidoxydans NBRC 16205]|uniref:Cytochrome P450 hydroxylase n=1 Tax=Pseudonocardia sulfidoxydans NBRC 16205 TaxID=1223511 RepID=A0A511D8W8_9PSEU|nr:cytochrome P450 [Pseudonocardia sulfidoxydans]GEL21232.1 cytochrome P450 hydroxylase [Pseudonocardia sulfidoxydans NBRC 16205]